MTLAKAKSIVRETSTASQGTLQEYCRHHLATYKVPAEIRVVQALPKTAVGKVDKTALAAMAAAQVRQKHEA